MKLETVQNRSPHGFQLDSTDLFVGETAILTTFGRDVQTADYRWSMLKLDTTLPEDDKKKLSAPRRQEEELLFAKSRINLPYPDFRGNWEPIHTKIEALLNQRVAEVSRTDNLAEQPRSQTPEPPIVLVPERAGRRETVKRAATVFVVSTAAATALLTNL